MVGFLLNQGASVRLSDDAGNTPLHYACGLVRDGRTGPVRQDIAKFLLERGGADLNKANDAGLTPLQLAEATLADGDEFMWLLRGWADGWATSLL